MASTPKKKAKTNRISEKQSALNKEYKKQINRIRKFIKSAQGRGFVFWDKPIKRKDNKRTGKSEVVFPKNINEWSLPAKPKKITEATINKLKKITTDFLYQRAAFIDIETAEVHTGSEGVSIERKKRSQKAAETRKRRTRVYTEPDDYDYDGYSDDSDYTPEYADYDEYLRAQDDYDRRIRESIPAPPSGNPFDYIFDDIYALLRSLAPSEDKYTKRGKLWAVDEKRERWSNALVKTFDRIIEEESTNGDLDDYSVYLVTKREQLSEHVARAKSSSKAEEVQANCEAIMKILNRGKPLEDFESDAIQKYMMGEIDDL